MVVVRGQGNTQFPGPGPIEAPQGSGHGAVIEDRHLGAGEIFPQMGGHNPGAFHGERRGKRLAGLQIVNPENHPALQGSTLLDEFVHLDLANHPSLIMAEFRKLMDVLPIQGRDDGPGFEIHAVLAIGRGEGHGVVAELAGDLLQRPHPGLVDLGAGLHFLNEALQAVIGVVVGQVELPGALHFLRRVVAEGEEGFHSLGSPVPGPRRRRRRPRPTP